MGFLKCNYQLWKCRWVVGERSWGPGQGEILRVWLGVGVKVLLKTVPAAVRVAESRKLKKKNPECPLKFEFQTTHTF